MPKSKTPRGRKASRSRTAAALTRKSQNKVLARSESDSDSQSSSLRPDPRPISIVGVGASAGGLEAFEQLLRGLPEDSGMGFVLVQHLAPKHESMLSELLSRATRMPVIEVTDGVAVQANYVYVIPPNADMSITDGVLHLSSTPGSGRVSWEVIHVALTRRLFVAFSVIEAAHQQAGEGEVF